MNIQIYTNSAINEKYEYKGFASACLVKSRNMFSAMGSGFKSMVGGKITGQTKLIIQTRNEVLNMVLQQCHDMGANAILGLRIDSDQIMDGLLQFIAYGTAVKIIR